VQPQQSGKWGYIDKRGKVVIQPQFDEAEKFEGGVAIVRVNNLYGVVNTKGQFVAEARYKRIWSFVDGVAKFELP
jgi:hypothetical protein